jgi:diguanylate cyclase (GGDEF)-like protein
MFTFARYSAGRGVGMRAVAAARRWWALRRGQTAPRAALRAGELPRTPEPSRARLVRGFSLALIFLAIATLVCAAIGLAVTQSSDRHSAIEQHKALQNALSELHAVFGHIDHVDAGQLRLIARRSGLHDLRFGSDPTTGEGRAIQSLQDAQGRIVGWFSWAPDRALITAMDWLWTVSGIAGAALIVCSLRLTYMLARSLDMMRKLTSEDAVTGLPNRRVMLERLDDMFAARKGQAREPLAFVLIDIDGFHELNEVLGRNSGEDVLRALAHRFRSMLAKDTLLGRLDDDQFAVVAAAKDAGAAMAIAEMLRASLAEPVAIGQTAAEQAYQITGCIGVALAPEDGTNAEQLARRAALAVRAAKKEGHGVARRFTFDIESERSDRRFLLRELKSAISAQAFDVHYQPIVAAAGGAIIGVEALVRWNHPERGAIAPSTFIPLAEHYGLMKELGAFVLRRALGDAARWPGLFVAVNLSPVQIRDPLFVQLVAAIVTETAIAPAQVVLEMTEGVLIDEPQEIQKRMEALRALGVSLALDDFGTGYSSLSYLQKFPFQRLKIDRAFVEPLGAIGNAGAIIHSIVALGHALGMTVLAEGVETDQQRVLLRLAGCDEMQGYLFAKPRPAEAIDKIVTRSASGRSANGKAAAAAS